MEDVMSVEVCGSTVRALRLDNNWSQDHLATLTNRSKRTIQRVESGGTCDLETRAALASVFKVNASELLIERPEGGAPGNLPADAYPPAPAAPVSPAALFAYASAHPRPLDLIHAIAKRRRLEVIAMDGGSICLQEKVVALGIATIRELDDLLRVHGDASSRLCDYLRPEGALDSSFILGRLFEIVAIERGGEAGIVSFCESLRYSTGGASWAKEIYRYYQEVVAYG